MSCLVGFLVAPVPKNNPIGYNMMQMCIYTERDDEVNSMEKSFWRCTAMLCMHMEEEGKYTEIKRQKRWSEL